MGRKHLRDRKWIAATARRGRGQRQMSRKRAVRAVWALIEAQAPLEG